jgi:hypothetical protein
MSQPAKPSSDPGRDPDRVFRPLKKWERPFHYEKHAEKRMRERGITREEIRKVVQRPDSTRPADRPDATVYVRKLARSRTLTVVVEERERFFRIVTAWVTR